MALPCLRACNATTLVLADCCQNFSTRKFHSALSWKPLIYLYIYIYILIFISLYGWSNRHWGDRAHTPLQPCFPSNMQSILLDSITFRTLAGLVYTGNQHRKIGVGIIPLELCIGLCMGRKEGNPCSWMSLGKSLQENLSLWSIVCYKLLPCWHLPPGSQAFEVCRTYKNKIRLLNRDILSLYLYFTAGSCLSMADKMNNLHW